MPMPPQLPTLMQIPLPGMEDTADTAMADTAAIMDTVMADTTAMAVPTDTTDITERSKSMHISLQTSLNLISPHLVRPKR